MSSLKQSGFDKSRSRNPDWFVYARKTIGPWMLEPLTVPYLRSSSVWCPAFFAWRTNGGATSPGLRVGISAEKTKYGMTARRSAARELEQGIVF